jgi:dATP/dGTP pyrophosphohydrolase
MADKPKTLTAMEDLRELLAHIRKLRDAARNEDASALLTAIAEDLETIVSGLAAEQQAAVEAEREACAKLIAIVEIFTGDQYGGYTAPSPDAKELARAIRSRGSSDALEAVKAEARKRGLLDHLRHQREFSEKTFGPGQRTAGVLAHIRKELNEIESAPLDLSEWMDVVILALDGAWRAGYSPEEIVAGLTEKQARNEAREWPDWRTQPADAPIEHVRTEASDGS